MWRHLPPHITRECIPWQYDVEDGRWFPQLQLCDHEPAMRTIPRLHLFYLRPKEVILMHHSPMRQATDDERMQRVYHGCCGRNLVRVFLRKVWRGTGANETILVQSWIKRTWVPGFWGDLWFNVALLLLVAAVVTILAVAAEAMDQRMHNN